MPLPTLVPLSWRRTLVAPASVVGSNDTPPPAWLKSPCWMRVSELSSAAPSNRACAVEACAWLGKSKIGGKPGIWTAPSGTRLGCEARLMLAHRLGTGRDQTLQDGKNVLLGNGHGDPAPGERGACVEPGGAGRSQRPPAAFLIASPTVADLRQDRVLDQHCVDGLIDGADVVEHVIVE